MEHMGNTNTQTQTDCLTNCNRFAFVCNFGNEDLEVITRIICSDLGLKDVIFGGVGRQGWYKSPLLGGSSQDW